MNSAETLRIRACVDELLRGYQEESRLYDIVREATREQRRALQLDADVERFSDLMDEKEDLLRMIGQIEFRMKPAKTIVTANAQTAFTQCARLAGVLDRLMAVIEDIRHIEAANADLLDTIRGEEGAPKELLTVGD